VVHDRLSALTRAHALSNPTGSNPDGQDLADEPETTLRALLAAIFAPFAPTESTPPFTFTGTDLSLRRRCALRAGAAAA
jgi:hypothetical protein